MKIFGKIIAVLSAVAILLTMTACHKKDEVAVTIDGIDITSALYMNALIECDMEAKSRIDEELNSSESTTSTTTEDVDYYSQTLDNMKYVDYVKSKALERCREYAFYQKLIDNKTISLTDEEKSEAEYYAEAYWSYYGYSTLFEANGVALETYKKAFLYSYYANAYFMHIYGEGGEKEVDEATIKKTMNEKYILVYALTKTYDSDATDEDKAAVKSTYDGYAKRLTNGEDFKKIYEEVNGSSESDTSIDASDIDDDETANENSSAQDSLATVIGDEDTNYSNDNFSTVEAMKTGEVKLVESSDKTSVTVYKKLDINQDPYYLKTLLNNEILAVLKEDEFEKSVDEEAAKLSLEENSFATKRFKVKKIVYPETSN